MAAARGWFRPVLGGMWFAPASWKGWAATAVYVVLLLWVSRALVGWALHGVAVWRLAIWGGAVAGLTWVFLKVARSRAVGE